MIFFISRPFRIIDLWRNSFQIFGFKGVIRKIFRNKDLGGGRRGQPSAFSRQPSAVSRQ
jgi:hypothetical protein